MGAPRCIPLDSVSDEPVGGKAEGLGRLIRDGFDVPPGFVIVDATVEALPDDLEEQYRRIGGGAVAVRSSALGEDSEGISFAGQYETVLGVEGVEALRGAVRDCLRSLGNARATAYRGQTRDAAGVAMNVVVQRMVDARAAGVIFTANPTNARRDQIVIDAIAGLGDALVSGRVTPEHWLLRRDGTIVEHDATDERVLDETELLLLLDGALRAEGHQQTPLDMEWAIEAGGSIRWLQARPITKLPADPNELDTRPRRGHVYTWCNIGEMMPGAVTPLTYSVTGRGIDVGMQNAYRRSGVRVPPGETERYVAMFFGHLFLDLTHLAEIAADVAGATKAQMCTAICGRDIAEIPEPARASGWRRALNGTRYFYQLAAAAKHARELDRLRTELRLPRSGSAKALYAAIDAALPRLFEAYELHLLSSSSSGALSPILLGVLAKGETPTQEHHAELARMLSGASGVESADIAEGADRIVELLLRHPDAETAFASAPLEAACQWIRSERSGEAGRELERYLERHGHRAVRELELRQPGWADDPSPLIASLQSGLRARAAHRSHTPPRQRSAEPPTHPILERLLPLAHAAIRTREHTKSALVAVTAELKGAYRALGASLVTVGQLPDEDAVFFLTHSELGEVVREGRELGRLASSRRQALDHQMPLQFPEIFRNRPEPLGRDTQEGDGDALVGKPVSRGVVTGPARVVKSLEEATALQAGEILIAPITDVGWTPYFSLIAGLATDVGSAVSHGAVVAREYGLPAVVNLRFATARIRTGEMVTLDGNRGTLTRA